jgi:neutral amino acid transport system permease protein
VLKHVARAVLAVTVTVLAVLGIAAPAALAAGTASGEAVQGIIRNGPTPVPDVRITVKGPGGFTGEATTNAQGRWVVEVPAPGSYSVGVDAGTLPTDIQLRNPDRNPVTTTVNAQQKKSVLFALGADTRVIESRADQALNRFAQGLRFGLLIALAAVGLSLIFGTTGLTNFAHGEMVTLGGLTAYFFNTSLGWPLLPATLLTLVACGAFGWLLDAGLWKPLRRRGTGLIAAMIVSIGLSILLRYVFLFQVGGSTIALASAQGQKAVGPGSITLTALDYLSMAISVIALLAVAFFLLRTRLGKATRAVADNPSLASASGIDVDRVISIVWISGAALAALAGVLLGIAQQVNFQMGFQILLLVFAAVTLGGLGTAFGALVGSIVVGIFVEMSTLVIPTELKNVGALGILILILLVRPQGILGRAQRVG